MYPIHNGLFLFGEILVQSSFIISLPKVSSTRELSSLKLFSRPGMANRSKNLWLDLKGPDERVSRVGP